MELLLLRCQCVRSAAPEYVQACACTAHEGVTKGHCVEAPHKSSNGFPISASLNFQSQTFQGTVGSFPQGMLVGI
eukprot:589272-Pelagomonas_calceolata.AAC.1